MLATPPGILHNAATYEQDKSFLATRTGGSGA